MLKREFFGIPEFQKIAVTFPWPGMSPDALDPSGASRPRCGRIHICSWLSGVWAARHSASALNPDAYNVPSRTELKASSCAKPFFDVMPSSHAVGVFVAVSHPVPKLASTKLDSTPHNLPVGAAAAGAVEGRMNAPAVASTPVVAMSAANRFVICFFEPPIAG